MGINNEPTTSHQIKGTEFARKISITTIPQTPENIPPLFNAAFASFVQKSGIRPESQESLRAMFAASVSHPNPQEFARKISITTIPQTPENIPPLFNAAFASFVQKSGIRPESQESLRAMFAAAANGR
jgi:hypothetical protein